MDRSRLLGLSGRGRNEQLLLAKERYQLKFIPTPAGGCKLTEMENAKRYWLILSRLEKPEARDFDLAGCGRHFWHKGHWLIVGRNKDDNQRLLKNRGPRDLILSFPHIPSPLALARHGLDWPKELLLEAGELTLSYACKALKQVDAADLTFLGENQALSQLNWQDKLKIFPKRHAHWELPSWQELRLEIKEAQKKHLSLQCQGDC